MYETTTLAILTSLIVMSTKYNCQDIRSEIVKHLAKHFPDNLPDFEKGNTTDLFSEPPEDHDFRLLAVAGKLNAPVLLPMLCYFCAINPLHFIFAQSKVLSEGDTQRIIQGRERLMKYSYNAGTEALVPEKKCSSEACFEKRVALFAQHINATNFDPPASPLQMPPQGILAADGGKHAEICKSCVKCYNEALKKVRKRMWFNLPKIFYYKGWDELRRTSAL